MDPEKNVSESAGAGDSEKKTVKKPPLSPKAVFWITVVLLVALAVLVVLLLVGEFSQTVAGIFILLIFAFAIVNKGCWKCPSCGEHLGRFRKLHSCPSCGEKLDI